MFSSLKEETHREMLCNVQATLARWWPLEMQQLRCPIVQVYGTQSSHTGSLTQDRTGSPLQGNTGSPVQKIQALLYKIIQALLYRKIQELEQAPLQV